VADSTEEATNITDSDIVFDCPHCGKSLAIEERGAGMMIVCPDCQERIQVPTLEEQSPGHPPPETSLPGSAASTESLIAHYDEIGREVELIQAALDRIVGILQDAAAGKPSRRS